MIEFLIFALVGIVTGTMAGLFGVGGGLIIVPVMHFILTSNGVSENVAIPLSIGTALACIIVTSSSAAYSHYKKSSLSVKRFLQLSAGIHTNWRWVWFFICYKCRWGNNKNDACCLCHHNVFKTFYKYKNAKSTI